MKWLGLRLIKAAHIRIGHLTTYLDVMYNLNFESIDISRVCHFQLGNINQFELFLVSSNENLLLQNILNAMWAIKILEIHSSQISLLFLLGVNPHILNQLKSFEYYSHSEVLTSYIVDIISRYCLNCLTVLNIRSAGNFIPTTEIGAVLENCTLLQYLVDGKDISNTHESTQGFCNHFIVLLAVRTHRHARS